MLALLYVNPVERKRKRIPNTTSAAKHPLRIRPLNLHSHNMNPKFLEPPPTIQPYHCNAKKSLQFETLEAHLVALLNYCEPIGSVHIYIPSTVSAAQRHLRTRPLKFHSHNMNPTFLKPPPTVYTTPLQCQTRHDAHIILALLSYCEPKR